MPDIKFEKLSERECQIFIDGELVGEGILGADLYLEKQRSYQLISECPIEEIAQYFSEIAIDSSVIDINNIVDQKFVFETGILFWNIKPDSLEDEKISLSTIFKPLDWKLMWSVAEFMTEFKHAYMNSTSQRFKPLQNRYDHDDQPNVKYIELEASPYSYDKGHSLKLIVNDFLAFIGEVQGKTVRSLYQKNNPSSISNYFYFPEEVKTACSQYLQYFYEFLKDIGIKAKVNLDEQDSGEILFSVIPDNKDEALENIRAALAIYLKLPDSRIEASDITAQNWNAQIFHLKGQLASAASIIQSQALTTQHLQIENLRLQEQLSLQTLFVPQPTQAKDEEEFFGGIIKIGEAPLAQFFTEGIILDGAALVRAIRKAFGKS